MTAQPHWFEAEFDEHGRLVVSSDMAERLRAQLGHQPQAGDKVTLALVDDEDLPAASDERFEHWLRTEVAASAEDMRAHPEQNQTIEQVRDHFAARFAAAQAAERE